MYQIIHNKSEYLCSKYICSKSKYCSYKRVL